MATIKVFSVDGVKQLNCFDTLLDVPYLNEDVVEESVEDDDSIDF